MAGGQLLWIVGAHLALTGLPGVASALLAARLGLRSVAILLVIALAASGSTALLAWWAYYARQDVGETFSYLVLFASIGVTIWLLWERRIPGPLLRSLALPLGLWALGTYFVLFLGFIHGGSEEPLAAAGTRFLGPLPSDNAIPYFFAEWFYANGHHGTPPVFPGEWLSSDRPPLQVGYALAQRPFEWDVKELHYQALGVVVQQLWIVGLWALLCAGRVGRVTRGLAMVTVLVSDVAIVNGFFVWPKLLPAAMLLGAAALILTPLWEQVRRSLLGAALVASLLGLAMMGHGGSVFAVIALALVAAWRGLPSWRWLGAGLLVGLLLMAPWSAYQKWGDPPGTRLTKYILAGTTKVDDRGVGEAIVDSYRDDGFGAALHNKGQNFVTMVGGEPVMDSVERGVDYVGDGNLSEAIGTVRTIFFFNLLPSLGLLLIAPFAMALGRRRGRRRRREWDLSLACWAVFGVAAVVWGLLVYGNEESRAVLHVGSFAIPILGFTAAVTGLRAVFPRFAVYYAALAAALMLALYVPVLDPPPGSEFSVLAIVVTAVALVGFCLLSFRSPPPLEEGELAAAEPAAEALAAST